MIALAKRTQEVSEEDEHFITISRHEYNGLVGQVHSLGRRVRDLDDQNQRLRGHFRLAWLIARDLVGLCGRAADL